MLYTNFSELSLQNFLLNFYLFYFIKKKFITKHLGIHFKYLTKIVQLKPDLIHSILEASFLQI